MLITKGYVRDDGALSLTIAGEAALDAMDQAPSFDLSVAPVRVAWRAELRRKIEALQGQLASVRRATARAEREGAA